MPDIADVTSAISSVESLVSKAEEGASKLEGQDRSAIAQKVVFLYIGAVVACFIFTIGIFWFLVPCPPTAPGSSSSPQACLAWKEPADYLLQVLTTAVLPIVTLVLGYYFGTAKADR